MLVSLNAYRNWHYHISNKFKKEFTELVHNQLTGEKIPSPYILEIVLFYKNKRCDGGNIVNLIEKVVLDALQEADVTTEDAVEHHVGTAWEIGGQDKENPRCEITITHIEDYDNG